MRTNAYDTRDYDFSEIEEDPRLKRAAHEMRVTFIAYAVYVFICLTASYLTAAHFAPNEVFWGGIAAYLFVLLVCSVIGAVVMISLTRLIFRDDSLDDEPQN